MSSLLLLAAATTAAAKEPGQYPIDQEAILALAKRLAAAPYAPKAAGLPAGLDRLTAEQYRDIRFAADAGIWRAEGLPFYIKLLPAGFYFQLPISISLLAGEVAEEIEATPSTFEMGPSVPQAFVKTALPLSGFSLATHLNSRTGWDEFITFQGASYFRALAKGQLYGLSARGLALNIAEPMGEEFPALTRFWIERPRLTATNVIVYALLESQSVTGAYRFTIAPGADTVVDVAMTLFARVPLRSVGVAPLTSMFLFDETNRGHRDDYRPEVHNSDGLQIAAKSGEQIWRPLANPAKLQISTFTNDAPRGFGLMQRSREAGDFQDIDLQYERRPSAWIEPTSDWGAGAVELVEIPSSRETNDNITAFWRPAAVINPGHPWHAEYRLTWSAAPAFPKGFGKIIATRSGASADGRRRLYIVDYLGAGEQVAGLRLDLSATAGKLSNMILTPNPAIHGLRAAFELDPDNADVVELRLRVMRGDRPVAETWLYRWTPS